MWARHLEIALALWMGMSPFVFRYEGSETALWVNDFASGAAILTIALLAHVGRLRRRPFHLLQLVVATWLLGFGWIGTRSVATPDHQNQILVGLLLAMLAIVPSDASRPPTPWRDPDPTENP